MSKKNNKPPELPISFSDIKDKAWLMAHPEALTISVKHILTIKL